MWWIIEGNSGGKWPASTKGFPRKAWKQKSRLFLLKNRRDFLRYMGTRYLNYNYEFSISSIRIFSAVGASARPRVAFITYPSSDFAAFTLPFL